MSVLDVYRDRRALVLGGGGFIGQWVAAALHARGADVAVAARDALSATRVLRQHAVSCDVRAVDLSRSGEATRLIRVFRPQIVFNLAGYGVDREERDELLTQRLNSDLVAEVAQAVEADAGWSGQALVHAGSALEFGTVGGDLSDPWRCAPTTSYGHTKLEGSRWLERISRRRCVRAVCARLFTVYGPGEHSGRLLPSLIEASRRSGPLPLTAGLQRRDFTYVEDVAEGLLRVGALVDPVETRALNLATGQLASVREFVELAAQLVGVSRSRLEFGSLPTRPEEMAHGPVSITELVASCGWSPAATIAEGVRRTLAFQQRASR